MKQELDIIRAGAEPLPAGVFKLKPSTTESRRNLRLLSDEVLDWAHGNANIAGLATACSALMLAVARIVDAHDIEPDVPNFLEAVQALIEKSRAVMDKGLMIDSPETSKCGAVMMELSVRGIAAALNLPYGELLQTVKDGGDVGALLVKSGHISTPAEESSPSA